MRRTIITFIALACTTLAALPAAAQLRSEADNSPSHQVDYRHEYVFGQQNWYHRISIGRVSGKSYSERIGKYYTHFGKEMLSEEEESGSYIDLSYALLRRTGEVYWGPGLSISSGYYGGLTPAVYFSGVAHLVDSWNAVQPYIGLNLGIALYQGGTVPEDFVVSCFYGYYNGYWLHLRHEEYEDSRIEVAHGVKPYLDLDLGITFSGIAKNYNRKIILGGRASLRPYVATDIELEPYRNQLETFFDNYNSATYSTARLVLPRELHDKMRINLGFYIAYVF